ncbi:hypothetical protein Hanom_Chr06g00564881 [Helianthus anomalus]
MPIQRINFNPVALKHKSSHNVVRFHVILTLHMTFHFILTLQRYILYHSNSVINTFLSLI